MDEVVSIKYILHGVMAQYNLDSFLSPIYNFLKPTKFF